MRRRRLLGDDDDDNRDARRRELRRIMVDYNNFKESIVRLFVWNDGYDGVWETSWFVSDAPAVVERDLP